MLLADREVHAVVVGAVATAEMVGPGALAVVLQPPGNSFTSSESHLCSD